MPVRRRKVLRHPPLPPRIVWMAVLLPLGALLMYCALASAQERPAPPPAYSLIASLKHTRGYFSQAAWLDDEHLLTLVIAPDTVEVWRTNIDTLERERFISNDLITGHICPVTLADRLTWTLSPQRKYIFFKWFEDNGARRWALLDISAAPKFRLKQFNAPAGMQIARVLFSADDRYAVFINDSFIEGSTVSVLAMDLEAGTEAWRIGTESLGFVVDEWWREDIGPRTLQCGAALFDGQFHSAAGLATASLSAKTMNYSPSSAGLLAGTGAHWGWACCSAATGDKKDKYFLEIQVGNEDARKVDLDLRPIELLPLADSGCVLLVNSADLVTNKLWLVSADNIRVPALLDSDCREVAVSPKGKVLVLAGATNEIRIYER